MNSRVIRFSIVPCTLLALWQVVVLFGMVSPIFIPSPYAVFESLFSALSTGTLLVDLGWTLYRTLGGFFLAVLFGVPIGLMMGYSGKIYDAFEFIVEFFRSIPATALFPLFLLVFGIGDASKFALVGWGAGLLILVNSMYGVHVGKELRVRVARVMRIGRTQLLLKVIFPEALPYIFAGFRLGLSYSLVIVVVTEMFIGTTIGLGHRIVEMQLSYRSAEMYAAIITAGVLGFLLNKVLLAVERRIVHWKRV